MSKRIKLALPVTVDGDNDIVDSEGFCVAYEGCVAPYHAVTSEIALRVNYHDRLVEALREVVEHSQRYVLTKDDLCIDDALELLAELEQQP